MRKFEIEAISLGVNNTGYLGAFSPPVDRLIRHLVAGKILHLYSGQSTIGDVRVDIAHPNATHNCEVGEYLDKPAECWDWIVLDPPYDITDPRRKLASHKLIGPLSVNVPLRRKFNLYCRQYTNNILWLDICAPLIKGFRREKLWLVIPLWYEHVRVLSWLKREMNEMFT